MNELELLDSVAARVAEMFTVAIRNTQESPTSFGKKVADMLADDWGGINVYIPKSSHGRLGHRNRQMLKEFNGENITELALKYGLSEQRVYVILAEERNKRKNRQAILPGLENF